MKHDLSVNSNSLLYADSAFSESNTMEFVVSETYDQLCHKICDAICTALRKATAQNRKCSVGVSGMSTKCHNNQPSVSGGSMPQMISGICAHLELPWNLVHFFYCDERMVPVTDPESTHRVYCELIYPNIPIPQENIHPVKTELPGKRNSSSNIRTDVQHTRQPRTTTNS